MTGFHQFVKSPTRNGNILDLVLCNNPLLVTYVCVEEPFLLSDHCAVVVKLNCSIISDVDIGACTNIRSSKSKFKQCRKKLQLNWDKTNWLGLNAFLADCDWDKLLDFSDSDELVSSFYATVSAGIGTFVPNRVSVGAVSTTKRKKSKKLSKAVKLKT